METTGKLISVTKDFLTGKFNLTFQIDAEPMNDIETFTKRDEEGKLPLLDIVIKLFRKKRSLDANSYFHVLVGKIAEAQTISKAKAKNILISRYGQVETLSDGSQLIYKSNAPVEYMMELEHTHCIPVKIAEDAIFYKIYRGSHTYDTYEMSKLIEGTVADAKEMGIDTKTPDEIRRMVIAWQSKAY
jgi:hypothetical protein